MPPVYRRVTAGVGHTNIGYLSSKRDSKGRFSADSNSTPAVVEAWRWPSFRVKTKEALNSELPKFMEQITKWVQHVESNADEILSAALTPTFNKSKIYCPKDTLDLVRSARMEMTPARRGGSGIKEARLAISYGKGGNPFYAIYVHEMLSYKHEAPTRAKFLESAIKEDMPRIREIIQAGARKAVGG
jgi:hypothetical protein